MKNIQMATPAKLNQGRITGIERKFPPINENVMFVLFRLGLYVAADHVPSKAKDGSGLMAQPEQL